MEKSDEGKTWSRYGLTELGWNSLSAEEREIHYNRQKVCDHPYFYPGIEGDILDERLREEYSHDPYFQTAHMTKCERPEKSIDECQCQMCAQRIGIPPDQRRRKVSSRSGVGG